MKVSVLLTSAHYKSVLTSGESKIDQIFLIEVGISGSSAAYVTKKRLKNIK